MPNSSLLGVTNRVITATLSAGSGSNVGNLALPYSGTGYSWTTATGAVTAGTGAWFVVDTGSTSTTWQAFSIHRTNLSASAVVDWIVAPNSAGTSPIYSATTTAQVDPDYGGQCLHIAPSVVTGRYLRVQITDSAATGNQISIGLAFAGPILQPGINLDYTSSYGSVSEEMVTTTRAGTEIVTPHWQARTYTASYSGLTEAEADVLRDIDYEARQGGNVLLVPLDTSANIHREAVYGRLKLIGNLGYAGQGDQARSIKFTITERVG